MPLLVTMIESTAEAASHCEVASGFTAISSGAATVVSAFFIFERE